jgi:hypothetical protein
MFVALLLFDPTYRFDMLISVVITLVGMLNMVQAISHSCSCCWRSKDKEDEVEITIPEDPNRKFTADIIINSHLKNRKQYLPNLSEEDDKASLLKHEA